MKSEKVIDRQMTTLEIPNSNQATEAVLAGTMIWVDDYVRDDGTKVQGYYRRK